MAEGMTRQSEMVTGLVFLGLMVIFVILAITTFHGTPTVLLIIGSVLFLGVGLFFLGGRGGGDGADQSQQQSVVLGDGHTISQSSSGMGAGGSGGSRTCSHHVPGDPGTIRIANRRVSSAIASGSGA
jgi:hypothetical protein